PGPKGSDVHTLARAMPEGFHLTDAIYRSRDHLEISIFPTAARKPFEAAAGPHLCWRPNGRRPRQTRWQSGLVPAPQLHENRQNPLARKSVRRRHAVGRRYIPTDRFPTTVHSF